MIIFGTRGVTRKADSGEFYCPDCAAEKNYFLKQVRRWFTLYFIPVIPLDRLGEYVECGGCKATFNERILEFNPKQDAEKFEAEFSVAAKRVMFKMALADGHVDESEIKQITQAFKNIAKRDIDPKDIAAELEAAKSDTRSVTDFLRDVASRLNDTGKELVLRSAIAVIKADGEVDAGELSELAELIKVLDMPKAYSNGVLSEEGLPTQ